MKRHILDYSLLELRELFREMYGERPFRANQVWDWIYKKQATTFLNMFNIPITFREKLNQDFKIRTLTLEDKKKDSSAVKYLFKLEDGEAVETVLILEDNRFTLCLSTQVGCKFNCLFCASGKSGFIRNLTTGEIIEQLLAVAEREKISNFSNFNIVFMGMGEPLDNYTATVNSIKSFHNELGLNFSLRRITVSTSGIIPKIKKLSEDLLPVRLAVSLHSALDTTRSYLMPINKHFPLLELVKVSLYYQQSSRRRVSFIYTPIKGINDQLKEAYALGELLAGSGAHINIVPYNTVLGLPFSPSPKNVIKKFIEILEKFRLKVTVRESKGQNIEAACGQLRLKERTGYAI